METDALTMEEEEQLHIEDLKFVHDPQDKTMQYVEWVEEDLHFSGFLAFWILFTPKTLLGIAHHLSLTSQGGLRKRIAGYRNCLQQMMSDAL